MRLRCLLFPCVLLTAASFVHGGDGKFTITFEEKKFVGTYKTDAKKKPKHLDMTIKEGDPKFEGKTALCIYEVDGDMLKWCANEPGKETRPEAFPDAEGERKEHLYLIFKRAK